MLTLEVLGRFAVKNLDGAEIGALASQPKRVALLTYLALEAHDRFVRRDSLLALFWPEADATHARSSLRQALYSISQTLGSELLVRRGAEEVGLDANVVLCDAVEFETLVASGRVAEGLSLYRGDLLEGLFVPGASPELEQWLDRAREQLRGQAVRAAWTLASQEESANNAVGAAQWATHAVELAPHDVDGARRLMELLDRSGDAVGALRVFDAFAKRLQAELEVDPPQAIVALATRIRRGLRATPNEGEVVPLSAPVRAPSQPPSVRRPRRRAWLLVAGAAVVATVIAFTTFQRSDRVVLAVGIIDDPMHGDTSMLARGLPDLLTSRLGRIENLDLVSRERLYEVLATTGKTALTDRTVNEVARTAGVTDLLEGTIVRRGGDSVGLEMRRVDVRNGAIRGVYTVEGNDATALADGITTSVAARLRLTIPAERSRTHPPAALLARRLYEEGLASYYRGEGSEAIRLFNAALSDDSTFAMAAYYASQATSDNKDADRLLRHAVRMARFSDEDERLFIRQQWANHENDPTQVPLAEELVARWPNDPGAHLALGRSLLWTGESARGVAELRRVIALDSGRVSMPGGPCRTCDAFRHLMWAAAAVDSLDEAERMVRAWIRAAPQSGEPWWALVQILAAQGRREEAERAVQGWASHMTNPGAYATPLAVLVHLARAKDAEQEARGRLRFAPASERGECLWWLWIALRYQGRHREALEVAEMYRALADSMHDGGGTRIPVAISEFELGRYEAAIALLDSNVTSYPSPSMAAGTRSRMMAWSLTHTATAVAAAGDTVRLATLADTIERWGRTSAWIRDRRLHWYVRGLLAEARGRPSDAERAFLAAMPSVSRGYTRINLELGRVLIAEHKYRNAIPVLRGALHGDIDGSALYATLPEFRELMADAFDGLGMTDSATVYYKQVAEDWKDADPSIHARALRARQRSMLLAQR
jgi:DNA-binding SARP family transcriptional activator/TolB-like protein